MSVTYSPIVTELDVRIVELRKRLDHIQVEANLLTGALQEVESLKSLLEAESGKAARKAKGPTPEALRKRKARAAKKDQDAAPAALPHVPAASAFEDENVIDKAQVFGGN